MLKTIYDPKILHYRRELIFLACGQIDKRNLEYNFDQNQAFVRNSFKDYSYYNSEFYSQEKKVKFHFSEKLSTETLCLPLQLQHLHLQLQTSHA